MPPAPTPGPRWADTLLDTMRQTQDPPADQVVKSLFASSDVHSVNQLMRTLVANDGLPPEQLPPVVQDYLTWSGRAPDWVDPAKIVAGERVFWRYGPAIIGILTCYSL